jgi:DNA-binding PadR family transcriptional regulator
MLTARAALLLALRHGPGYGRAFGRRIRDASAGHAQLAEGSIYPALRQLQGARLVRSWKVVPGRRRGGRSRTYYELTLRGLRTANAHARGLQTLVGAGQRPSTPTQEIELMGQRIELGAELSETALLLSLRRSGRTRSAA